MEVWGQEYMFKSWNQEIGPQEAKVIGKIIPSDPANAGLQWSKFRMFQVRSPKKDPPLALKTSSECDHGLQIVCSFILLECGRQQKNRQQGWQTTDYAEKGRRFPGSSYLLQASHRIGSDSIPCMGGKYHYKGINIYFIRSAPGFVSKTAILRPHSAQLYSTFAHLTDLLNRVEESQVFYCVFNLGHHIGGHRTISPWSKVGLIVGDCGALKASPMSL